MTTTLRSSRPACTCVDPSRCTCARRSLTVGRVAVLAAIAAFAFGSFGCASAPRSGGHPQSAQAPGQYPSSGYSGAGRGDASAEAAPSPATAPPGAAPPQRDKKAEETAGDRPGLATHWGENRESRIRTVSFERASETSPFATAALWYNDREGSRAMASTEGFRAFPRTAVDMAAQGVTISLNDENGRALSGFSAGGKTFAVGQPGSRYTIVLRNNTPARFEAVVSVDGLDVIDGKDAGFGKRGYLLNPHASLEIEGFRRSEAQVAAFRFGSVRGSYADKSGGDTRNVGVIGVALFHERGVAPWPWDSGEIERRKSADPFPGRFATPPQ